MDRNTIGVRPQATLFFAAAALLCAAGGAFAQAVPFRGLDAAETAAIVRGESVFRQPSSWRGLCVPEGARFAAELVEETRRSGANYLGEVIAVLPRSAHGDALPALLASILSDVQGHVGIPYYSERNKQTYPLYSAVKVTERSGGGAGAGSLSADIDMLPFRRYRSRYSWATAGGSLSFRSVNETAIEYKGTKAVAPGDLVWRLEAYAEGDRWILYGIGRVKAFDMMGLLRDRLSPSFMGRIEAFYRFVFGKLR